MNDSLINTTASSKTSLHDSRHVTASAISGLFLLLIILLGFFGNGAVIIAITYSPRLSKEKSNIFLINLAATDMMTAVFVMISSFVSLVQDKWMLGEIWCDIVCSSNYCFIIVSMLTLCFISIDRYQAIIHPFQYGGRVTKNRIALAIGYTWFQGIAFGLAPAIMGWVIYDYWEVVCAIQWNYKHAVYYVITAFIICFMIPGIIMVFCYVNILKEAKGMKMRTESRKTTASFRQMEHNRKINRTIRSLLIVLVCFFICMSPFSVGKLLKVMYPGKDIVPGYVSLASSWIGYMSSAINPLIYGIFRRDFRIAFLIAVHRIFHPNVPLRNKFEIADLETLSISAAS